MTAVPYNKKKVLVGLSGGVDSAVSAALLKERGYDVVGVFIRTWHPPFLPCTEPEDRRSAMRVAAHLSIPFTTLDLSEQYKKEVADALIGGYGKGHTPNPDALCNKSVKFGGLYEFARAEGAAHVATGHYARVRTQGDEQHLYAGKDPSKDQSYFLWMVPETVFSRVLFPLGECTKREVRVLAEKFGLPNAKRPDSQGICFLGDISMKDFLRHYLDVENGRVLDEKGAVIGTHEGTALYTIGQRHGFVIEHAHPDDEPRYVTAKDMERNTLTVSRSPAPSAQKVALSLSDTNWLGSVRDGAYEVRFRYRQPLAQAQLTLGTMPQVLLQKPVYVPIGQSLVLYAGERVVGGGTVASVSCA